MTKTNRQKMLRSMLGRKKLRRRQVYKLAQEYINPTISNYGGFGGSFSRGKGKKGGFAGSATAQWSRSRFGKPMWDNRITAKTIQAPAASATVSRSLPPLINGSKSVRYQKEEFVGQIYGSTGKFSMALSVNGLPISPHIKPIFNWLARQARFYQSYEIHRLVFKYRPQCPTDTAGHVMMCVQYDPAIENPQNANDMLQNEGSISGSPWQNLELVCSKENLHKFSKEKFCIGWTETDDASNKQNSTCGKFFINVGNEADGSAIGHLYVEYDITLKTSKIDEDVEVSAGLGDGTGVTQTVLFGTTFAFNHSSHNAIRTEISLNAAGDTFTFPYGFKGIIFYHADGTGLGQITNNGSTATITKLRGVVSTDDTLAFGIFRIVAAADETLKLTFAAFTTCTAVTLSFHPWRTGATYS